MKNGRRTSDTRNSPRSGVRRPAKAEKPKRGKGSGNHRAGVPDLRGNSTDRKARKQTLLQMNPFCWKCGTRRNMKTATQDRVRGTKSGGKYNLGNVRLACDFCNKRRGGSVQKARK